MFGIGKVSAAAAQSPALALDPGEVVRNRRAAVEDLGAFPGEPLAEVPHPPKRRDLAQLVGADGHAVEELFGLGHALNRADHGPDAVAGQAVSL